MTDRGHLRVVRAPAPPDAPQVLFCGHCGEAPPNAMAARSRVCALCGLGVVIGARGDVAPVPGDSFVIVDRQLKLCALSGAAEALLDLEEPQAVHRPIAEILESADVEAGTEDALLEAIIEVAGGPVAPRAMVVRPRGEYGVRFGARIASCGPPTGALIVLAGDVI